MSSVRTLPLYVTDEPSLVDRLRRHEAAALGEVYDAHHDHLRAFARRLIGDDSSAEDLVQETFLAVPSALRNFRGDGSLRSFLLGIAANHARHHLRAACRRRAAHAKSADECAPPSTPEDHARRKQLAQALIRALDELPFEQRLAIVLCEVEERSAVEVAQIVSAPEATVRTRLFHAKKKLRESLARIMEERR